MDLGVPAIEDQGTTQSWDLNCSNTRWHSQFIPLYAKRGYVCLPASFNQLLSLGPRGSMHLTI